MQKKIEFNFELFKEIIGALVENNVTDMHIAPGTPPFIRQAKELKVLRLPGVDTDTGENIIASIKEMLPADTRKFAEDLILYANHDPDKAKQLINEIDKHEIDTTLSVPRVSRFRVHISLQRSSVTVSLRVVPSKIPSVKGFPQEILNFIQYSNGMVIVSGKTSSGKSTTLAMMIDEMNKHQNRKIVSLEDPIEYLHKHNRCMVIQREVGNDTETFMTGLRAALREDPDVLVIGEMRDVDSFQIALNAAESGCLVLTTMHSGSAPETLERIVSMFSDDKQNQVRNQLSSVLRGIVCQQLIPCVNEAYESPLVAAFEVMTNIPATRNAIRQGKFGDIANIMETQKKNGMRTMEDSLNKLKNNGLISDEDWFIRRSRITSNAEE
ncbi:type IV pilus twitching motility protein PilT [Selenomonas montiformis]|uniref:type IV pilus twitching motility protein PilT n=1 Tax=Selenomonas montiformis TaxID=2652285 RepID=UPI003F8CF1F5